MRTRDARKLRYSGSYSSDPPLGLPQAPDSSDQTAPCPRADAEHITCDSPVTMLHQKLSAESALGNPDFMAGYALGMQQAHQQALGHVKKTGAIEASVLLCQREQMSLQQRAQRTELAIACGAGRFSSSIDSLTQRIASAERSADADRRALERCTLRLETLESQTISASAARALYRLWFLSSRWRLLLSALPMTREQVFRFSNTHARTCIRPPSAPTPPPTRTHTCTHTPTYVNTHTHARACTCVYLHTLMIICTYSDIVCIYIRIYMYIFTYTYLCIPIYTHKRAHTHAHTMIHLFSKSIFSVYSYHSFVPRIATKSSLS